MGVTGCGKFFKYSLFLVNFLIFVGGLGILGLGSWAIADNSQVQDLLQTSTYKTGAGVLLGFGGIVAFISFLGCCGAIKEVKCLLLTFFIILLLISIAIIVGVVFAAKIMKAVNEELDKELEKSRDNYKNDKVVQDAWDETQSQLKCCGVKSSTEWSPPIPQSCLCSGETDDCSKGVWKTGCEDRVKDLIKKHAQPMLAVGIVVIIIIVLAMVFSCSLFMMI